MSLGLLLFSVLVLLPQQYVLVLIWKSKGKHYIIAAIKMETFKLGLCVVILYSACTLSALEEQGSTAIAQVSSDSTNDNVVYTYSEAIVKDGKPVVSQLTIAKGKDKKYHYAKTENGTYQSGIWEGPLPKSPDVSQIVGDNLNDITKQLENPLAELNLGIGNTLQDYLTKAMTSI